MSAVAQFAHQLITAIRHDVLGGRHVRLMLCMVNQLVETAHGVA